MKTLNIKDPEVYRLADDLAKRAGTSKTAIVREAPSRKGSTCRGPKESEP